jgi:hypothetical protein
MLSATRTASVALALLMPVSALAQNNGVSDPFAKEVEQKCTAAAGEVFRKPMIAVDPSGTETYGVAILYGRSKELKGPAAVVCVVDRKTGKVEIGTPLGKEVVRVRRPKPAGQENVKQQNNKKMQNQTNSGNVGGQDDDGDDDQQQ